MIGVDDARAAIESLFKMGFASARPTVPIRFTNVEFQVPPVGGSEQPRQPWVAFDISEGPDPEGGRSSQKTVGQVALFAYIGEARTSVFVAAKTDAVTAWAIASDAAGVLRRQQIELGGSGPIRFGDPYGLELGPDGAGWFQVLVVTPFRRSVFN